LFDSSLQASQFEEGDCATRTEATSEYTIVDERAGSVACYRSRGRSFIQWTDELQLVYSVAERGDLADLELFRWWVESAGPLQDLPGFGPGHVVPKDTDAPVLDPIEGSFSATVTEEAAENEEPGVRLLTGDYHLELSSGNYTLTRALPIDQGTYGLSKGNVVVFFASGPSCEGVGTYGFTVEGGSVTFEPTEEDACPGREFVLAAGPWSAT
jgi:hypothetical protein